MFKLTSIVLAAVLFNVVYGQAKVVCYYDSRSLIREGAGKIEITDIDLAIPFCTHLVYGYAGIKPDTNKLVSLNETADLDSGPVRAFRLVTTLKKKYPALKVLLSVGGNADPNPDAYFKVLESSGSRLAFINSVYTMVKTYEFDGLDLAWQFPTTKPVKRRSSIGSFFHKLKKTVGASSSVVDENAEEHREGFTALVRELKGAFTKENYLVSITVLPNVNSSIYMDVPNIINNVDYVVLSAFDFQTPDRNPKDADFPAPLKALNERNPEHNVEAQVAFWLTAQAPTSKMIVGIPTFGRAWKLNKDSGLTGVPPLEVESSAPKGLLSWPEVCVRLPNPSNTALTGENAPLHRTTDPSKRYGTYAYRAVDENGDNGIWIGYEDPDTAGNKAKYARERKLGGVGVFDLSLDDVRGTCSGEKFQILRAVKYQLDKA